MPSVKECFCSATVDGVAFSSTRWYNRITKRIERYHLTFDSRTKNNIKAPRVTVQEAVAPHITRFNSSDQTIPKYIDCSTG